MVATLEKPAGTSDALATLLKEPGPMLKKASAVLFAVGLSEEQVEQVLDQPPGNGELLREMTVGLVLKVQMAMNMTPERRIAAAQQVALDVKMKLLHEGDAKTKLAVSTEMLDRHMGKPTQTVQTVNTNLNITSNSKELDDRIAKMNERLNQLSARKMKLVGPQLSAQLANGATTDPASGAAPIALDIIKS